MSSYLVHSFAAVLIICLVGGSPARAQTAAAGSAQAQAQESQAAVPAKAKKVTRKSSRPQSAINAQVQAAESENPASVDYGKRKTSPHKPTNEEVYSAEKGSPVSVEPSPR